MTKFTISKNDFLKQDIKAFYHTDYNGMGNDGNPDYLNDLKNTFNNFSKNKLDNAINELEKVLKKDLLKILEKNRKKSLTVCVIPRAKVKKNYHKNQLLFKSTVKSVIKKIDGLSKGVKYIKRHKDTKTTHLQKAIANNKISNYDNKGKMPYPGITKKTCDISDDVKSKDILLIDDIYTSNVNIDEDAIQALLDNGANSVIFYAVAKA